MKLNTILDGRILGLDIRKAILNPAEKLIARAHETLTYTAAHMPWIDEYYQKRRVCYPWRRFPVMTGYKRAAVAVPLDPF